MTPEQFAAQSLKRWEGGMSRDPNDAGNWSSGKKGVGVLLGSNKGVTGPTLAAYRGVKVESLKMSDMEKLTDAEAVSIAVKLFYKNPGLDRLVWNRVTASIMDFGYNAGPGRAVRLLQDLLDVTIDGKIGPGTTGAYSKFIAKGEEFAAGAWWAVRERYYEDLVARTPSNGVYLRGWDNRSAYFTPGDSGNWWKTF